MKLSNNVHNRRKKTIHHLNRISGQIETLKDYINKDKSCRDIAQLTTSIAKSFDSLRSKTLEGFILNDFSAGKQISPEKKEMLGKILKLYKK